MRRTYKQRRKAYGRRSPATHRNAPAIALAAFNRVEEISDVSSPLKGLKKP
jgi:hypothetical protein